MGYPMQDGMTRSDEANAAIKEFTDRVSADDMAMDGGFAVEKMQLLAELYINTSIHRLRDIVKAELGPQ